MGDLFEAEDAGEIASQGGVERAPFLPLAAVAPGRGGRKPGALNRKTLMLGKYMQAKGFRDPAVTLAEIAQGDPLDLLTWIKSGGSAKDVSLLDVLKLQADCMKALLPYLHAKITPDAVIDASSLPAFHLHLGGGSAPGGGGGLSILDMVVPNEINGLAVRRGEVDEASNGEGG
jgi:hypothetical protein